MMWHPYKWLDDLAEKSGWWIVPVFIIGRVGSKYFMHNMPENIVCITAMIFSVALVSFFTFCYLKQFGKFVPYRHFFFYLNIFISAIIYPALIFYFVEQDLVVEGSIILGLFFMIFLGLLLILLKIIHPKLEQKQPK